MENTVARPKADEWEEIKDFLSDIESQMDEMWELILEEMENLQYEIDEIRSQIRKQHWHMSVSARIVRHKQDLLC